jgi:NAD(P)-dependent dehydrogenase (short-subunit alcohol dehydrogenase family)
MMEIAGKTAFVTGAASGIGLGIATALSQAGVKVMLNAPNYLRLCHDIQAIISCNSFARHGRLFPRRFRIRTPGPPAARLTRRGP